MTLHRRDFVKAAAGAATVGLGALASAQASAAANRANKKIVVGVMGTSGRGQSLCQTFAGLPDVAVAYVCDVDQRNVEKGAAAVVKGGGEAPKQIGDFRKMLEDPSLDAIVIAAPNHWHAPATILGCSMGKHVYCEKPCSHNPYEGEMAVEASRKYKKVVQHGTQRRSYVGLREAVQKLHEGLLGRLLFARGWYNNERKTIGVGKPAAVPEQLDYALWQGPAPVQPYKDNLIHYNWHWHWHWGNGELGNNGIHSLDVCRWGMDVTTPVKVSSGGGKYRYPDDDQQTPDTHVVTFDFPGDKSITWEGRSWSRRGFDGNMFGIAFYGENGSMVIDGGKYRVYDTKDKLVSEGGGAASDSLHAQNFVDCIRSGDRPHADIEEAHRSTLLCHLGNISHRTGRTIHVDPKTSKIVADADATALWRREYQPGWEPKV